MSRTISINLTGEIAKDGMHVRVMIDGEMNDVFQLLILAMRQSDNFHAIICNASEIYHGTELEKPKDKLN
jgi:hypothetical protein